jgi:hypothetical protein
MVDSLAPNPPNKTFTFSRSPLKDYISQYLFCSMRVANSVIIGITGRLFKIKVQPLPPFFHGFTDW